MLFTFVNHHSAIEALGKSTNIENKTTADYFAVPTLFNSILWNVVVKEGDGFKVGYYSVFDKENFISLYFIAKNDSLMLKANNREAINKLIIFSKGFYSLTENNGKIYFNDLRFGQVEGWAKPQSAYAFSFDLTPGADNHLVVQQGRIEGTKPEILESMFLRISGIKN
jgi:inner membrane protein